jgi:hypothetical protein
MEKEVGHLFPWVIFHSLATSYQRLSLHRFRGQLAQTLLQFSGGAASAVKTWDVTSCPTKTGNIRHRCGTCICMWLLVCVYVYVCVYACIDIRICIYTHICCIHFAKMKQLIWEKMRWPHSPQTWCDNQSYNHHRWPKRSFWASRLPVKNGDRNQDEQQQSWGMWEKKFDQNIA